MSCCRHIVPYRQLCLCQSRKADGHFCMPVQNHQHQEGEASVMPGPGPHGGGDSMLSMWLQEGPQVQGSQPGSVHRQALTLPSLLPWVCG